MCPLHAHVHAHVFLSACGGLMVWMPLMYSMYFVVVTLLFQLLAKRSSATLPCKQFINKRQ